MAKLVLAASCVNLRPFLLTLVLGRAAFGATLRRPLPQFLEHFNPSGFGLADASSLATRSGLVPPLRVGTPGVTRVTLRPHRSLPRRHDFLVLALATLGTRRLALLFRQRHLPTRETILVSIRKPSCQGASWSTLRPIPAWPASGGGGRGRCALLEGGTAPAHAPTPTASPSRLQPLASAFHPRPGKGVRADTWTFVRFANGAAGATMRRALEGGTVRMLLVREDRPGMVQETVVRRPARPFLLRRAALVELVGGFGT